MDGALQVAAGEKSAGKSPFVSNGKIWKSFKRNEKNCNKVNDYHHLVHNYHHLVYDYHHSIYDYRHLVNDYRHLVNDYHHLVNDFQFLINDCNHFVNDYHHLVLDYNHFVNDYHNISTDKCCPCAGGQREAPTCLQGGAVQSDRYQHSCFRSNLHNQD